MRATVVPRVRRCRGIPMNGDQPQPASWVGGYQLLGCVAISATGSVWRGRDHALGRDVALKQVVAGAVRSVEQLRSEARLLAQLSHPNIVSVIDLIDSAGQTW